ncbi:DUF6339 family protein [Streptomyces violaceus]|uniref:DUF6339 family protein n=1 Tax=Streptomyces violaceus TaxID=1936 RepID=A0ABY9UKV7_STRVL|nr:DUF6339 family protein [Streptomyces janthinus]WND21457.1 DUF6339 family protein [Streptomyces janthinus]GGS45407.1 hypothetical protein GCM10010270_14110 [Streptomyces janthinus]
MNGVALPLEDAQYLFGIDAAVRLTPAFRLGSENLDVCDYIKSIPGGRKHRLEPVRTVLDEAMKRYARQDAAASDAWLGPRFHAALRLSRREAGCRDVWRYLGLWAADYVRWRWAAEPGATEPDNSAGVERFVGPDSKQALARLWWMTELFRNGSDYSTAALALTNQDIINNFFRAGAAHHRPTALAFLSVLPRSEDGERLPDGRSANALSKAINAAASTLLLDSLAVDEPLDGAERRHWEALSEDHEVRNFFDEFPEGPDDPPVPPESLETMTTLLAELLTDAHIRGKKKG